MRKLSILFLGILLGFCHSNKAMESPKSLSEDDQPEVVRAEEEQPEAVRWEIPTVTRDRVERLVNEENREERERISREVLEAIRYQSILVQMCLSGRIGLPQNPEEFHDREGQVEQMKLREEDLLKKLVAEENQDTRRQVASELEALIKILYNTLIYRINELHTTDELVIQAKKSCDELRNQLDAALEEQERLNGELERRTARLNQAMEEQRVLRAALQAEQDGAPGDQPPPNNNNAADEQDEGSFVGMAAKVLGIGAVGAGGYAAGQYRARAEIENLNNEKDRLQEGLTAALEEGVQLRQRIESLEGQVEHSEIRIAELVKTSEESDHEMARILNDLEETRSKLARTERELKSLKSRRGPARNNNNRKRK